MSVRDTVIKSLSAIGGQKEAAFYAQLFKSQAPERFALIVLDPRCLKNPLLEALISDLRILADLELTPVLLVGALDEDRTSIKFQAQRLYKDLDRSSIKATKLNCGSYGLISDVIAKAEQGRMVVLEMLDGPHENMSLTQLVDGLRPQKVIFLQPSGGLQKDGERVEVVKLDDNGPIESFDELSLGQNRFMSAASELALKPDNSATYIIASPLNLLAELFTTKGSGTLMRRAATIKHHSNYDNLDAPKLRQSIEESFSSKLRPSFFEMPMQSAFIEQSYRGGAIITSLAGLPYLSKFWVIQLAQGEGIARDIWDAMCKKTPTFFWRSRLNNPFNDWYMRGCDGMQIVGEWRIFWRGLDASEIPGAIIAASNAPHDFDYDKT